MAIKFLRSKEDLKKVLTFHCSLVWLLEEAERCLDKDRMAMWHRPRIELYSRDPTMVLIGWRTLFMNSYETIVLKIRTVYVQME